MEDSHTKPDQERLKGEVVSWVPSPAYGYHGYIRCENQSKIPGLVLVNSTLLREPGEQLATGDHVEFKPVPVARGYLAKDVVVLREDTEAYEGADPEDASSYVLAVLRYINPQRYFAILELSDGRTAFLHFSSLQNPDSPLLPGSTIKCRLEQNIHKNPPRLEAFDAALSDLRPAPSTRSQSYAHNLRKANELLAKASLAREQGHTAEAAGLYERTLRECPVPQAVLNYAAMKRAFNEDREAARIFQTGMQQFPKVPIIHEHAGLLAASVSDFNTAIKLLNQALHLSRQVGQSGEKGILLNLARTYYRIADTQGTSALKEAIRYYAAAAAKFGDRGLPFERDKRNFELARFRTQHYRGGLAVPFLQAAGFEIVRAQILPDRTTGGDLIVRTNAPELGESYGLSSQMLVRCMFQSEVTMHDLNSLDAQIRKSAKEYGCEEGAAFLIMASLTEDIQRILNARISDRREHSPAIIPISQQEIEQPAGALTKLRGALDKWLFRRDLFATNAPVHGDRFFGRKSVLSEIGDDVSGSRSVGIFGLRKVGKTSLLHELRSRSSASGDVVLYLDLLAVPEGVADTSYLYWELANQLKQNSSHLERSSSLNWRLAGKWENVLDISADFKISIAFDSDLKAVLKLIGSTPISPHPKIVLMLDEVERLLPSGLGKPGFQGFFDFFSYFRGLSQQTKDLTMIVTAANPSIQEAAQFDSRDNPVFNYFKETYLKLLTEQECTQMITTLGRGMGIRFASTVCNSIYTLTGGHPFITRMLCSYISDTHQDRPLTVTPEMVSDLVDTYVDLKGNKDFNEIFERLNRDYPEERDLCIELAKADRPLPFSAIQKNRVRHLLGYQLVRVDGAGVALSMDLMKRWLSKRA